MSDPLADLERAITAIRFAEIVDEELKRTIIVPPRLLDRVRWLVEQHGAEKRFTIMSNPWIPADSVFVLDEQCLQAGLNESLDRSIRSMFE